jgi:hypothetical protein
MGDIRPWQTKKIGQYNRSEGVVQQAGQIMMFR